MKEISADLLNAALDREGGSGKKSKTTVLPPFPTSVSEDVFHANDEQDYLMVFKCKFLSALLNLNRIVTHK